MGDTRPAGLRVLTCINVYSAYFLGEFAFINLQNSMENGIPKTILDSHLLPIAEFLELSKQIEHDLLTHPMVMVQAPCPQVSPSDLFNSVIPGDNGESFEVEFQKEKESRLVDLAEFANIFAGSDENPFQNPTRTIEEVITGTLNDPLTTRAYAENLTWKSDATSFRSSGDSVPFKLVPVNLSDHISGVQLQGSASGMMSTLSSTNFIKSTNHTRQPAMEILGVTAGSPVFASAGSGTTIHIEQAHLYSVNACHSGWKIWQYEDGLLRWLEDMHGGTSIDAIAKDILKWATPEECERYGISVAVQPPGCTVFIGAGVPHTVFSLTSTAADASNIMLNPSTWSRTLSECLKEQVAQWYFWFATKGPEDMIKIQRLARYFKHTADYLRAIAIPVVLGITFDSLAENAVIDLAGETSPYAAYALKRGTALVYLMAFRHEQPIRLATGSTIIFSEASRSVIPRMPEDFHEGTFVKISNSVNLLGLSKGVFEKASGFCIVQGPDPTRKRARTPFKG